MTHAVRQSATPDATPEQEVKQTAGAWDKVMFIVSDLMGEKLFSLTGLDKKLEKNWVVSPSSIHHTNTESLKAVGGKNLSPEVRNCIRLLAAVVLAVCGTVLLMHLPITILCIALAIPLLLAFSESGFLSAKKVFKLFLILTTSIVGILAAIGTLPHLMCLVGLVSPFLYVTYMLVMMRNPPRSKNEDVGNTESRMEQHAKETRAIGGNPPKHSDRQTHSDAAKSAQSQLMKISEKFQEQEKAAKAAQAAQSTAPSAPSEPSPTPSAPSESAITPKDTDSKAARKFNPNRPRPPQPNKPRARVAPGVTPAKNPFRSESSSESD